MRRDLLRKFELTTVFQAGGNAGRAERVVSKSLSVCPQP